jgi:hypothetical protein
VISFTFQLLYPWGQSPWYPLDKKLDGPRIGLGTVMEKKLVRQKSNIGQPAHSQSLYD